MLNPRGTRRMRFEIEGGATIAGATFGSLRRNVAFWTWAEA